MIEDWQQDYPTYDFQEKEVVLAEYRSAARTVESEEKLFANASNITLAVLAAFGSVAVGASIDTLSLAMPNNGEAWVWGVLLLLTATYSLVAVRYFADRQKTITFAKRKIVVLRRMLGLDYGSFQLVLPNWREEGANQPFAIKLFPGWASYVAYPFLIITVFSTAIFFFIGFRFIGALPFDEMAGVPTNVVPFWMVGIWVVVIALLYRRSLFDTHQGFSLGVAKLLATVLQLNLRDEIEYIIYKAKLAVYEQRRVGVKLDKFKEILVFVEDRKFWSHRGIDFRSVVRAFLGLFQYRRRSGGSTITQQLARTLFVAQFGSPYRRKIVEIALAVWMERVLSKDDILNLYLASVRFEYGVYGLADSMKYFFGQILEAPNDAEVFFLIERVSNIRSLVLASKIDHTLRQAVNAEVICPETASEVVSIYDRMLRQDKLKSNDPDSFERLLSKWCCDS